MVGDHTFHFDDWGLMICLPVFHCYINFGYTLSYIFHFFYHLDSIQSLSILLLVRIVLSYKIPSTSPTMEQSSLGILRLFSCWSNGKYLFLTMKFCWNSLFAVVVSLTFFPSCLCPKYFGPLPLKMIMSFFYFDEN